MSKCLESSANVQGAVTGPNFHQTDTLGHGDLNERRVPSKNESTTLPKTGTQHRTSANVKRHKNGQFIFQGNRK